MALLIRPTRRGILWETIVLILGVIFYMVALSVAVVGAAAAAGGNGRPTISDVKLTGPPPDIKLSFRIHADGVESWSSIEVYVNAMAAGGDVPEDSINLYESLLRPDDKGVVEQQVDIPISLPTGAVGVSIFTNNTGNPSDLDCGDRAQHGPSCTNIRIT
ncbi:hypothetical protein [Embleya sp. NPDC001921]